MKLTAAGFCFDFSKKTHIMGVLNVTWDSFSDGGLYLNREKAIEHAHRLVADGADIIDIGGESTRPGSESIPWEEEVARIVPVIQAIAKAIKVPISVDTYKAEVARRALEAGAVIVNDVSGLQFDSEMPKIVAQYAVPLIVMHMKGKPRDMQKNPVYEALIPEILDYFRASIKMATRSGICENKIIIDPGIGFGKTFLHNLEILKNLSEFKSLAKPIVVGVSRKAFIGKILGNVSASERLEGTASAVAISILNGADIVRVHDVKEMVKVAKVADAIKRMGLTPDKNL
ncbi:MAG: dihydropteroate synthase [Dissulfurispiraceae bacterium]